MIRAFSPSLSLCMIVKDEEQHLPNCLHSVQGLVDEIIIVDTGSTDRTKEIARSFGAKVFDFAWCDDFAAARNESLKQATGDWILVLDADEELAAEDHERIKEAVRAGDFAGYRLLTRNYSNDSSLSGWQPALEDPYAKSFQGWYPSVKVRLFRRHKDVLFQGRMHELIDAAVEKHGKVAALSIPIHHYGAEKSSQKAVQYVFLSRKKIAAEPQNAKAYYELGVQYKQLGEFSLAEKALERAVELDPLPSTPFLNLAIVQQKLGKIDAALSTFQAVLNKKPQSADAFFGLGFCYFKKNDLEQSARHFSLAIKQNPLFLDAYTNLGAVYEKLGKYAAAEQCFQKALELNPKSARIYYNMGVLQEKQANPAAAVRCYEQAIALRYSRAEDAKRRVEQLKQFLNIPAEAS